MTVDHEKGGPDESSKAPQSKEPTGGLEDETQTGGTQGAPRISSPPVAGAGSDSGRGADAKEKQADASGKVPLSPPPAGGAADSSRRAGDADKPPEKMAPAPASRPRCGSASLSRKKRKQKIRKAAAAAAAAAGGTIEDVNPPETDHGVADDYPGLHEERIWKQLELFRRHNLFHPIPVEPPPEQLVDDLCGTYVRTIELTMEKRWRNINFNRWVTILLCVPMIGLLIDFIYHHMIYDDLFIIKRWRTDTKGPLFIIPLIVHFITWPLVTIPLVVFHYNYRYYIIAVNAYLVPMFSIVIAAGFVLYMPRTDEFEQIVEYAIEGVMATARHLEDASTEATRQKIADVYPYVALWAVGQSFVCCFSFYISTRNLSALRYYSKYSYESEHPARTAEQVQRSALVGQCTKRVPLTKYQNIADTRDSRTPRTPHSRSVPNSPMAATAVAETTPLL